MDQIIYFTHKKKFLHKTFSGWNHSFSKFPSQNKLPSGTQISVMQAPFTTLLTTSKLLKFPYLIPCFFGANLIVHCSIQPKEKYKNEIFDCTIVRAKKQLYFIRALYCVWFFYIFYFFFNSVVKPACHITYSKLFTCQWTVKRTKAALLLLYRVLNFGWNFITRHNLVPNKRILII